MIINQNGKEFGPYIKEQVLSFYEQNKIVEETRIRLIDDNRITLVKDLLEDVEEENAKTSVIRLEKLKELRDKVDKEKQIEKEKKEQEKVKNEFKKELKSEDFQEFRFEKELQEVEEIEDIVEEQKVFEVEEELDKTIINRVIIEAPIDKTIVMKGINELDDKDNNRGTESSASESLQEVEIVEEYQSEDDNETVVVDISGMNAGLKLEVKNSEKEIKHEIEKYQEELSAEQEEFDKEESVEDGIEDIDEEAEDEPQKRKKIGPIFAVLFLAIAYMFMEEDAGEKVQPPKYLSLKNPVYQEFADEVKSKQLYEQALILFVKGSYKSKYNAINVLNGALSFDSKNEKAADLQIYIYADLIENIKDQQQAQKFIYSKIRANRSRINKSQFLAAGTAKFFLKIKNPNAAYNTLRNYINLYQIEAYEAEQNKVKFLTPRYVLPRSVYLESLIAMDMIESSEANRIFSLLGKMKKKDFQTYQALLTYLKAKQDHSGYFDMLKEARIKFPTSVHLLLQYADFLFIHGDLDVNEARSESKGGFNSYLKTIEEITFLNFEGSPYFFARLLEHKGMAFGLAGKQREAIINIKRSLNVLENNNLRRKLALFELMEKDSKGTEKVVNSIVNESKVLAAIQDSRSALRKNDFEKAIIKAFEAKSILPLDNRARLNLARVQIARGYFELALLTLEEIANDNILTLEIQVELVSAYIKSKKLREAEVHIGKLLKTEKLNFTNTWQYPSLVGRIYHKRENLGMAINKLRESIDRNPLNADDLFLLSEIFLKFRKYKRCKYYLALAMELDPENVDYHLLYANTIYELQDADTAIGYLKRRLEKDKGNAKIMGAIANYYYLAGLNKEFEMYKRRIEKAEKQDKAIYKWLIKVSIEDGKWDEVIKHAKNLIVIDPSDLDTYMVLGENLINRRRFIEAHEIFDEVAKRLQTYGKLNYFKAKIFIEQKNYEEAIKFAQKEIAANPQTSFGYTIEGVAYIKLERYPDAIKSLKLAISKNGKDVEALMALADVRYQQDLFDEARELYLRVKRYDPGSPILYRQLGHIYRKIGQPMIAIENYTVYLEQNPAARDRSQIEGIIRVLK